MIRVSVLMFIFVCTAFSVNAFSADEKSLECKKWALDEALNFCQLMYHPRSQSYASCKLAAGRSFEHDLVGEAINFSTICEPFFLMQCKTGMNIYLGYRAKCGQP